MQGDADAQVRTLEHAQALDQAQETVDVVAEAALPLDQGAAVEAAGHVQGRQEGQTDPGFLGGIDQGQRHGRRIGIRPAVRLVVQVVEFADLGVSGLEHLDIELGGDRTQVIGSEQAGKGVHDFAPAPEAVLRIAAGLGESGHRPLEGMRVQVRHARHDPATEALGGLGMHIASDLEQGAG